MLRLDEWEKDIFRFFDEFCSSDYLLQTLKIFWKTVNGLSDDKQKLEILKLYRMEGVNKLYSDLTIDNIHARVREDFNVGLLNLLMMKPTKPYVELRVAGGYVRDKILGIDSDDIDFSVNLMKGLPFTLILINYIKSYFPDENIRYGSINISKSGCKITRIDEDEESNKYIGCAKLNRRCFGLELDFVHLRTESYTDLTRKPTLQFGTPKEDALRRDLTINALFYNIHTHKVEDYIDGVEDLKYCRIRTPVDPYQTFLDDPLRIIRSIRFTAKFKDGCVDPHLLQYINSPPDEIQQSFYTKIKRDRLTKEVEKIFSYAYSNNALKILFSSKFILNWFFNLSKIKTEEEYKKFFSNSNTVGRARAYSNILKNGNEIIHSNKLYQSYKENYLIYKLIFRSEQFVTKHGVKLLDSGVVSMFLSGLTPIYDGFTDKNLFNNMVEYCVYHNCKFKKDYVKVLQNIYSIVSDVFIPNLDSDHSKCYRSFTQYLLNKIRVDHYMGNFENVMVLYKVALYICFTIPRIKNHPGFEKFLDLRVYDVVQLWKKCFVGKDKMFTSNYLVQFDKYCKDPNPKRLYNSFKMEWFLIMLNSYLKDQELTYHICCSNVTVAIRTVVGTVSHSVNNNSVY